MTLDSRECQFFLGKWPRKLIVIQINCYSIDKIYQLLINPLIKCIPSPHTNIINDVEIF